MAFSSWTLLKANEDYSLQNLTDGHLFITLVIYSNGSSQVSLEIKNPHANEGDVKDMGSVPRLGRCPQGGHGNILPYSCLEIPMDRGACRAIAQGSQRVGHDRSDLACSI